MRSSSAFAVPIALALALALGGCQSTAQTQQSPTATATASAEVDGALLQLDTAKQYGDIYADGVLPVGDEKWNTTAASVGTVFLCHDNFVADSQAGAQNRGPWFINGNAEWDSNEKVSISGSVHWSPEFNESVDAETRLITSNDLPDHHTGTFPVAQTDPAHVFDANPNTISGQSLSYSLPAHPTAGEPSCMGGEVGIMLTGVALFNGFDAGGRDAGAWEVQDTCDGHPQGSGEYHYHSLSRCIDDVGVGTVIGFALDGFPITGPVVSEGNVLTTIDLDECHGIVSEIELDGELVTTYHYVMTKDFPYSASCFRGTAVTPTAQGGGAPPTGGKDGPPPPPPGKTP